MPPLFKDLPKDVNDFFGKYYNEGLKGWKIELKHKGPDSQFYANPIFEKNSMTWWLHYDAKSHSLKTKLGLAQDNTLSIKATREKGTNKFELTENMKISNLADSSLELAHEWKSKCPLTGLPLAVNTKSKIDSKERSTEFGACAEARSDLLAGGGGKIDLNTMQLSAWSLTAKYLGSFKSKALQAFCSYDNKSVISGGLLTSLFVQNKHYDVAARIGANGIDLGFESSLCSKSSARIKYNLKGEYGTAFIMNLSGNTTASFAFEGNCFDGFNKLPKFSAFVCRE